MTAAAAKLQLRQRRGLMIPWWQKILSSLSSTLSLFTVGDNRPPLDALVRILSRRDAPSLNIKWRQEARIL